MRPPRVGVLATLVAAGLCMALSTEARKFLVAKPLVVDPVSLAISHPPLDTSKLRALGATILGEYYTCYLAQVSDDAASAFSAAASRAGFSAQEKPSFDEININGYKFPSGSVPPLPADLTISDYPGPVGLYLVQFVGPQKPEWLAQITAFGEIVRYYPENTFLVRGAPTDARKFPSLASVQFSSVFQPAFKVRQDLLEAIGPTFVTVQLDSGQPLAWIGSMIQSLGPTDQTDLTACGPLCNVSLSLLPGEIRALASQPQVLWIEPVLPAEPSDERQTLTLSGHSAETPPGSMVWKPTSPTGYQSWLESKHFCTSTKSTDCWNYWTRVAVFDSGIDSNVCGQQPANCVPPADTHITHPDFGTRQYRYFCGLDNGCVSGSKYD